MISVQENYELKELIDGATATVRKVIRKQTGEIFAIKMYQNHILYAKNEIDMLIRLDHPNIVNIYEVFEQESTIILVLDYLEGGELYQNVGLRKSFTQAEVREYMKILIDAVRYCHELGVVHRDIKPQNLLLSKRGPEGVLKLADFGISRILSDGVLTTTCGTPVYMAPEIWQGQSYNQKVDIWSIGVVMYYLLCGYHPFNGDIDDIGQKIIKNQLTFQEDIWCFISAKAIDLLRLLLSKNPSERPLAHEIEGHIWLCHNQPILIQIEPQKAIKLNRTVQKIKRAIYKQKIKKANKRVKQLMNVKQISLTRKRFLIYEEETQDETEVY